MRIKINTYKPTLRVMADYGSSGFWNESGMVVLDNIPISESLKQDIKKWIDWYRKQLDWSNPGAGCIFSESEKTLFLINEEKIFKQIESEIGNKYNIEYLQTDFS
jgi:hypothetical protein